MGLADGGRFAALRTRNHQLYLLVHELVTKKFMYTEHADASAKASHFHLRLSVILLNSNSNSSGRVAKPANAHARESEHGFHERNASAANNTPDKPAAQYLPPRI